MKEQPHGNTLGSRRAFLHGSLVDGRGNTYGQVVEVEHPRSGRKVKAEQRKYWPHLDQWTVSYEGFVFWV